MVASATPLPDTLTADDEDGRCHRLLQLSDKAGGAGFTAEGASLPSSPGATLDAFRAARRSN